MAAVVWLTRQRDGLREDNVRTQARFKELIEKVEAVAASDRLNSHQLLDGMRAATQRQDNLDHNLGQVRLLAENLDRKMEQLTGEFIERHVTLPLFKHLAALWFSLRSLLNEPHRLSTDEVQSLADEIERLLDHHGLLVVLPSEGQPLDPHAHQPVQTHPTDNPALHGCIAGSFQPGLRNAQRVLQAARVAVFTCTQPQPKETT
jgi:molecular chaperone GrpE (heat shock protein)